MPAAHAGTPGLLEGLGAWMAARGLVIDEASSRLEFRGGTGMRHLHLVLAIEEAA